MNKSKKDAESKTCYCWFCHEEIPLSTLDHPEGMDYTQHFCGTQCYEKWKKEHPSEYEGEH